MRAFMDEDFLLRTETAKKLYHDYAEKQPIIDYHCHLEPQEIHDDIRFPNVGRLMLGGDHYKWRAMRSNGEGEPLDPAHSDDWSRFLSFARTLEYAVGNPLYHWTHLELKRVFGVDEPLCEASAKRIWDACNEKLAGEGYSCRQLISRFNVKLICTTDDPASSLEHHLALAKDASFGTRVLPAFRPDGALKIEQPGFGAGMRKLGEVAGVEISTVADVEKALEKRLDYFHAVGARISDHGLDETVPYAIASESALNAALQDALAGRAVSSELADAYKTRLLTSLGRMYAQRGWVMQIHMGALRDNNTPKYRAYGANTGFDSVCDAPVAKPLSRLLDAIETAGGLPKTILYSINPCANYVIGTMLGNFQGDTPGKIQMGSGWWFCDQRDGMREQMRALASLGLLGRFVGMLTDSRSFISYPRHEYFRRIFCDLIGGWVEDGEYPNDEAALSRLVKGVCYENAEQYFGIPLRG